jgi:hypothetical protein
MAIASGLPIPAVYILDEEPAINSFAAGLTSSDAVVTVTRGTLQKLSRDELQGVVAHEFSHILNGDMRMNVRVSAIIFGILVIGLAGRATLWGMRYGRIGSSRGKGGGGVLVVLGIGVALLVVGYVGYFFGRLIQASVSRQREFLADASAVQFTRNPAGVTGALKKIGGYAIGSSLGDPPGGRDKPFLLRAGVRLEFRRPLGDPSRRCRCGSARSTRPSTGSSSSRRRWSTWRRSPGPRSRTCRRRRPPPPRRPQAAFGAALAMAAGTLTPEGAARRPGAPRGRSPASIRAAARSPHDAPILVFGLLLDDDEAVRQKQLASVAASEGATRSTPPAARSRAEAAQAGPQAAGPPARPPALKALPPTALGTFAGTLDDLVQADGQACPPSSSRSSASCCARSRSTATPSARA